MSELIRMASPRIWGNELAYLRQAVESGWISSEGGFVTQFEEGFAKWLGARYAVAVPSGTVALHLALASIGVGPGDEVIVPALTMAAPVFAICYCGAKPVPVDIDSNWNLNPDLIREKVSTKTKAVMAVHNYGYPSHMDSIELCAREYGLKVVEDSAEAMGARWAGRQVGTIGDAGCFSLYANKLITCGEGGVVVTNDEALHHRMKSNRNMNFGLTPSKRFVHEDIGFSYRMSNLQAAFACGQLEHIDECISARTNVGQFYDRLFADIPATVPRAQLAGAESVYWMYAITLEGRGDVEQIQTSLLRNGIESRRFFPPLSRQPFMRKYGVGNSYPAAEHAWQRGLLLPLYVDLSEDQILRIVGELRRCLED